MSSENVHPIMRDILNAFTTPPPALAEMRTIEANSPYLKLTHEDRLRNIVRTFRKCKEDPKMVLPTTLTCLLEAASIAIANEEAKANAYANDAIKRDQLQRHEPRETTAGDLTTDGRQFVPGR